MPNFGKLSQDLIGGTLSIGDKLVIDSNLNLMVGNVMAGNVTCTLFTSKLVEQTSFDGIRVYGNLHIEPGFYLTGDFKIENETFDNLNVNGLLAVTGSATITNDVTINQTLQVLTIGGLTSGTGPVIQGNVLIVGGLSVTGPELVVPQIVSDSVCTDVLLLNTIAPKTGTSIEILQGNVVLNGGALFTDNIYGHNQPGITAPVIHGNVTVDGGSLFVPRLVCQNIDATGNILTGNVSVSNVIRCDDFKPTVVGGTISLTGNVDILGGCVTLSKQNGGPAINNIVYTSTSAGVVTYYTDVMFNPFDVRSITLINPCIHADSVVHVTIGAYAGPSSLIVQRVVVTNGQVDIWIMNLLVPLNVTDTVPLQYLIH